MRKYLLIMVGLFLIPSMMSAQIFNPRVCRENSIKQIKQLKENGVLLVRLQDRKKNFEMLLQRGYETYVKRAKEELNAENNKIIKAFAEGYTFSQVYFFYSSQSHNLLNQQWDSLYVFDKDYKRVDVKALSKSNIFVAEFGYIEKDTFNIRRTGYILENKVVNEVYTASDIQLNGLVVKSDKLVLLNSPFPFFVRTFNQFFFRRSKLNTVKLLNKRLDSYYQKVSVVVE